MMKNLIDKLERNYNVFDRFDFLTEIGNSQNSSLVFLVFDKFNEKKCVCKAISKDAIELDIYNLSVEVSVLKKLMHPNISHYVDFFEDEDNFYLFEEYCKGITLLDFINLNMKEKGEIDEKITKHIIKELLQALRYMHSKNVAHRDLKPDNIIIYFSDDENSDQIDNSKYLNIDENSIENLGIKIIDFGFSTMNGNQKMQTTLCGSMYYIAPEVLAAESSYGGCLADIWSLGVLMFVLLTGNYPFYDENVASLIYKIQNRNYHLPLTVSDEAANLLRQMLNKDPNQRISASSALQSDFLKDSNEAISLVGLSSIQPGFPIAHLNDSLNRISLSHKTTNENKNYIIQQPQKFNINSSHTVPEKYMYNAINKSKLSKNHSIISGRQRSGNANRFKIKTGSKVLPPLLQKK